MDEIKKCEACECQGPNYASEGCSCGCHKTSEGVGEDTPSAPTEGAPEAPDVATEEAK